MCHQFPPSLPLRWLSQSLRCSFSGGWVGCSSPPSRMPTPGAAAASEHPETEPSATSVGQEALICLVGFGLAEYVRPTRVNIFWVIYPTTVPWASVSRALRLAVRARKTADYVWELRVQRLLASEEAQRVDSPTTVIRSLSWSDRSSRSRGSPLVAESDPAPSASPTSPPASPVLRQRVPSASPSASPSALGE